RIVLVESARATVVISRGSMVDRASSTTQVDDPDQVDDSALQSAVHAGSARSRFGCSHILQSTRISPLTICANHWFQRGATVGLHGPTNGSFHGQWAVSVPS